MEIRKLSSSKDYLEAEEVQRMVWNFPDRELVCLNDLVATQKTGGHVFGAFENGRMVAFCFGTPGYGDGKPYHYSRMLGVLPGYQDSGLGYSLKLKQRDYVLEQGLDRITWTFDPLQSRNAYFNIEKLGCVIRTYVVNLYPESTSPYNAGVESDRFAPDWWIATRRVKDRLAGRRIDYDLKAFPEVIETRVNDAGFREPTGIRTKRRDRRLAVEIPDDIDALKKDDLALAQRWREATRDAFLACFKRGYVVHGFASLPEVGRRRSFYLLEKGFTLR